MSDRSFTAKKKYHDKRVDIYSIPGTSEVQYFAKKSFKISHLKHSTAILIFNFLLTHPSISSKKTSNLNRSSSIIGGPL